MPKTLMAAHPRSKTGAPNVDLLSVRSKQSFIQWPTQKEIQRVSGQLARIQREGMRSEAEGEYFKSGDLAYQIQEIMRATAELLKKSQRAKR